MRAILSFVLVLAFLIGGAAFAQPSEVVADSGSIVVDGLDRTFEVTLPEDGETESASLLVVLHGALSSGAEMLQSSGFAEVSSIYGALVIYPDSYDGRWHYQTGGENEVDDVAFIDALLDYALDTYDVDPDHMYVVGYSNGGMMAVRLRCDLADRLAAVGVIGATMDFDLAQSCVEAAPVPYVLILGNEDEFFPWNGVMQVEDGVVNGTFSAAQTLSYMASLNECEANADTVDVTTATSVIQVIRQRVPQCAENTEILFYAMIGMGHAWPVPAFVNLGDGAGMLHDAVWAFFASHPRN